MYTAQICPKLIIVNQQIFAVGFCSLETVHLGGVQFPFLKKGGDFNERKINKNWCTRD